jgi:hypothetical protein
MNGVLAAWPPWPQFVESKAELNMEHVRYKQEIVEEYGIEAIQQSWLSVCKSLESVRAEIVERGNSIIPIFTLDKILDATEQEKNKIRDVGCFVVRNVVPSSDATSWFNGLKTYIADNRESVTGGFLGTHVSNLSLTGLDSNLKTPMLNLL